MLVYALVISILIPLLSGTRLEVCMCCGDETGQPISKNCEIPAKSLSTEELTAIQKLCEERGALQTHSETFYDYNTVKLPVLFYIAINKSRIDYPAFPLKDCATIRNDKWFWIPKNEEWKTSNGGVQIARKVISSNYTDQDIYELIAYKGYLWSGHESIPLSFNPSLGAFNGSYEFLLRVIPQQTLHDIKFGGERKVMRDKIIHFGQRHIHSVGFPNSFTTHVSVPRRIYYNINESLIHHSILEVQDENDTMSTKVGGYKEDSVVKSQAFTDFDFRYGWSLTLTIRGKWVDTQKTFTAKLRSTYFGEGSKTVLLTTDEIVTGTKLETTIELINSDYDYHWFGVVMVEASDKVMAAILFTIAGVMILGVIIVCVKKVCCCCVRDRVTTGYQRIDERITAEPSFVLPRNES